MFADFENMIKGKMSSIKESTSSSVHPSSHRTSHECPSAIL